jgi:aminoglycoside phosphotransferase (APT) family kinase protein
VAASTPAVNPEDRAAGGLAAGVAGWLADRFGGPVTLADEPRQSGEGFDSTIVMARFAGPTLPGPWAAPLVLRVKSDASRHDEAIQEAAVHRWLGATGYPVPGVLAVLAPGEVLDRPVQVLERAPGALMIDRLRAAPWAGRGIAGLLARLHVRLHTTPPAGFPTDDDLLDRRLRLTRHTADLLGDPRLTTGLARVEAMAPKLRDGRPSVCHGDFHPLNVLVTHGGDASVIDWTDAGVGDRHGDVARTVVLFGVASIVASSAVERVALRAAGPVLGRAYLSAYDRLLPLDRRRLTLWKPAHLLHGWSQAAGLHAGLFARDGEGEPDDRAGRLAPAVVDELRRRFEAAIQAAETL